MVSHACGWKVKTKIAVWFSRVENTKMEMEMETSDAGPSCGLLLLRAEGDGEEGGRQAGNG